MSFDFSTSNSSKRDKGSSSKSSSSTRSSTHPSSQNTNTPQYTNPREYIMYLQRTIGNQAVGRLFESGYLQKILNIKSSPSNNVDQNYTNSNTQQTNISEQIQKSPALYLQRENDKFGQTSAGSTRHLISDLSSPITIGSEPNFELIQHGEELWDQNSKRSYKWTIIDLDSKETVLDMITEVPQNRIKASRIGNYKINITVLSNGKPSLNSISMNQTVIPEDRFLTKNLSHTPTEVSITYRELVNDFQKYITISANSTGVNGITPLFLACVLFIEIYNRPKEGREEEIQSVGFAINDLQQGEALYPWQVLNRSIGVGQIRMSTAAMATGRIPWINQQKNNRGPARDTTEENFKQLSINEKRTIFTMLKWPKSNILMAAKLLTKLKNRNNRFPTLSKDQFVNDPHAVGVVASEYNLGPSDSTADEAAPSWYGESVWSSMQTDKILQHYFQNS